MLGWIALATACLLPATTVPAGIAADGLPVAGSIDAFAVASNLCL